MATYNVSCTFNVSGYMSITNKSDSLLRVTYARSSWVNSPLRPNETIEVTSNDVDGLYIFPPNYELCMLSWRSAYIDNKRQNILLYLNENGVYTQRLTTQSNITLNTSISDTPALGGVTSLSVTADSGINHILYNNVTYDTFPATIPLSVDSTEMSITSKNKTSSRLGGVIRRVKNRISNLCENRMEVAYGVV